MRSCDEHSQKPIGSREPCAQKPIGSPRGPAAGAIYCSMQTVRSDNDEICLFVQYTVFRARQITFFLVNRVENQNEPKRPQGGGRLGSFWFSTRPSAYTGTDYNPHRAQCMV